MPTFPDSSHPRSLTSIAKLSPSLVLLAVGGVLLAAVRTENVNWDEFALFQRVANFVRTGELQGGGRPGLVEILLAPVVRGCSDALDTAWTARTLWVGITLAYLAGFWALLRALPFLKRSPSAEAMGIALLVMLPVFPRWGLQVRTDQPALALGLWGATILVAGRRSALAAFCAGLMLGAGYLFSQKAAYVAALALLLFALSSLRDGPGGIGTRRRVGRILLGAMCCAAGALAAYTTYRIGLSRWVRLPSAMTVGRGLDTFAHYRRYFGYRAYEAMLPTLLPHAALLGGLVVATARRWRESACAGALLASWAVLALGAVVGIFHAAAFPYFWMTLGLFPALALAVALDPVLEILPTKRARQLALIGLWSTLVIQGTLSSIGVLRDSQGTQREALGFIARNFEPDARGFHPEGALFCREVAPFPVYFGETIVKRFGSSTRAEHSAWLEAEFRTRPVQFLVPSHVYGHFPPEVQRFWEEHYRPYSHGVWVPGAPVSGRAAQRVSVDLLVGGNYRWRPSEGREPSRVAVGGKTLTPGEHVELDAGVHELTLLDDVRAGRLELVLREPPEDAREPFYSDEAIGQIAGAVTW